MYRDRDISLRSHEALRFEKLCGMKGESSAGDAALVDTLALALEMRTMMDERDGCF